MLNLLYSAVLVGLPAGGGAYLFFRGGRHRDVSAGFGLILYAAVLTAVFALFLHDGKLVSGNFQLKMPVAFVTGGMVGALSGALRRKNTR